MTVSVNTADLHSISAVFTTASGQVSQLRGVLSSGATAPESAKVAGSTDAASRYTDALQQWLHGLDQLVSSLNTMSRKLAAAGDYYAQAESGNTVTSEP